MKDKNTSVYWLTAMLILFIGVCLYLGDCKSTQRKAPSQDIGEVHPLTIFLMK